MFMIMMPIMYITTYLVLDGKDAFLHNEIARFSGAFIYGFIVVVLWYKMAQTPGMKAYDIKVVNLDNSKITIKNAILRYSLFILSATTIVLLFIPLFRKDKMMFHDILSGTKIIKTVGYG